MAAPCSANPNYIAMMTHLLELGLDINELDDKPGNGGKGTPRHYAVHYHVREAVQFLLEKGADPHKKNQWGLSATELAANRNYMWLLQDDRGEEVASSHAV